MSIEFSPPTRLLSVLDTLVPSDTGAANSASESSLATSTLLSAGAQAERQTEAGDRGSALLAQDFGSRHLTTPDQDELPLIDTTAAANLQAQQWVQFILAAWA